MAEVTAAHARDLGDYLSLARRRWAWIVACVLVGAVASFAYLNVAQETYQSTAKVLVKSVGEAAAAPALGERTNDAINLDTEAQLVTSEPVSSRASELLGSGIHPVLLARRVTVAVPPNTTVMAISFTAPTAAEAQRGAAAFAEAYLENRQNGAQGVLSANITRIETQIEKTTAEIQNLNVGISRLTGPKEVADRAFLVAARSSMNTQLASFQSELAPLVGAELDTGDLIGEAQLPAGPIDPNPFLILPAGLMAGLVAGLALAAWREHGDKRIHQAAEVERLFGLVPMSTVSALGRGRRARVVHDVRALYHTLRANGPEGGEVVLLVGPDTADAAEHLSYSLALVAARSGSDTAFVARQDSEVLAHRRQSDLEKIGALRLPDYGELGVVIDGELRSANLRDELRKLAAEADFLILGLPNNDPAVDLPILGRHVNMAVVVIRLGVTRRDSLATVLADLTKSGVETVVTVTVDLGHRRLRRGKVNVAESFADAAERPGLHRQPQESSLVVVGTAEDVRDEDDLDDDSETTATSKRVRVVVRQRRRGAKGRPAAPDNGQPMNRVEPLSSADGPTAAIVRRPG